MLRIQRDPERLTDFARSFARYTSRQRRFGFSLCFWLLFLCIPLYGIDRDRSLDQLYHTGWTHAEGAPGEVHALAQTTDGYLWLGTATGLFRSDGVRFQPYKPQSGLAFPQRSVVSLFAIPDGGLWVGYRYGGVSFIKNGTVTAGCIPAPRTGCAAAKAQNAGALTARGALNRALRKGSLTRS
jgi:ligand-binding sensor domain-containing protein